MPYIGTSPSNGVRRVHTYTATASQTTFTGASSEGVTLSYVDTNYIDVFQNGVLLGSADYTSTSGTSVVLAQGASADDLIVIVVYDVFSVADTVSKTNGGSFDSAVTMSSTLAVTGNQTNSGNLTVSGAFTSQGIDDNADATAVTIDSDENVCIGVTSKNSANNGSLTVGHTGMTKISASASGNADELVLIGADASANVGMSIIANNANQSNIFFGDEDDTDIGGITYDHSDNSMRFTTNTSERMRVTSGGNLLIGTTSYSAGGNGKMIEGAGQVFLSRSTTGQAGQLVFQNPNGSVGQVVTSGTSTAYNTSSDYRLKENVVEMSDATTRLKQLQPKRFNFISDADTTVDGFLAHEVQLVVPEAITGTHNEVDDDDNPVYQGIDQSKLVPLLVKTIQELEARITALENAE